MMTGQGGFAPLLGAALLALSACVPVGMTGTADRAVAVAGGAVTVAGPQGYCVDRGARSDALVLLGSCAALAGSRSVGGPARPAILTASVAEPPASGIDLDAMAGFVRSAPGRAALSQSDDPASVTIEEVSASGGVLFIRLSDSAMAKSLPVETGYWRALTGLRGYAVTLSVLSPASAPLSPDEQRAVLNAFVARMRAANPPTATVTAGG